MRAVNFFTPCFSRLLGVGALLALLLGGPVRGLPSARADDKPGEVNVGSTAPDFQSIDDQGKPWRLKDHVGKKILVLYLHPASVQLPR
jgi:hypothetical protein